MMAIALGFILRIVAGAFAVEVEVSHWMVLCTFFLSLFLGFSKRKKEIESLGKTEQRSVLKQYDESQLNLLIDISVSLDTFGKKDISKIDIFLENISRIKNAN